MFIIVGIISLYKNKTDLCSVDLNRGCSLACGSLYKPRSVLMLLVTQQGSYAITTPYSSPYFIATFEHTSRGQMSSFAGHRVGGGASCLRTHSIHGISTSLHRTGASVCVGAAIRG